MITAIRTLITCTVFFLFLSLTFNGRTIFDYIYSVTSEVTLPAQKVAGDLIDSAKESALTYTRQIFDNSVPRGKDSVRTKASAPVRKKGAAAAPEETIYQEEKTELNQLIKLHR